MEPMELHGRIGIEIDHIHNVFSAHCGRHILSFCSKLNPLIVHDPAP